VVILNGIQQNRLEKKETHLIWHWGQNLIALRHNKVRKHCCTEGYWEIDMITVVYQWVPSCCASINTESLLCISVRVYYCLSAHVSVCVCLCGPFCDCLLWESDIFVIHLDPQRILTSFHSLPKCCLLLLKGTVERKEEESRRKGAKQLLVAVCPSLFYSQWR